MRAACRRASPRARSNSSGTTDGQCTGEGSGCRRLGADAAADLDAAGGGSRHRGDRHRARSACRPRAHQGAQSRRDHPRCRDAAHGRRDLPAQDHGAAADAGGDDLDAHAIGRRGDARGARGRRGRFHRQAVERRGQRHDGAGERAAGEGEGGGAHARGRAPRSHGTSREAAADRPRHRQDRAARRFDRRRRGAQGAAARPAGGLSAHAGHPAHAGAFHDHFRQPAQQGVRDDGIGSPPQRGRRAGPRLYRAGLAPSRDRPRRQPFRLRAQRRGARLRPSALSRRAVPLGRAHRRCGRHRRDPHRHGQGRRRRPARVPACGCDHVRPGRGERADLRHAEGRVRARGRDAAACAGAHGRRDPRGLQGAGRVVRRRARGLIMQSGTTAMSGVEDVLRLPAVLDLAAAEGFLGCVHQHLQTRPALCLDASAVETLTLPCVQIILAAVATQRVSIAAPSDAFESAFRDLALDWRTNGEGAAERETAAPIVSEAMAEPARVTAGALLAALAEPPPFAVAQESAQEPAQEPAAESEPMQDDVPGIARHIAQEIARDDADEFAQAETMDAPSIAPAGVDESIEREPSQSDQTDGSSMAKRILTIDDSKTMRDMLMLTLEEAGFEVLQAVDGQHGLDVLGDERVDCVITDINMPKLDGYGVIRKLRANPVHKTTPILVLTTESDAEKKVIAREAGATGWMVKPFDPDRLIATIRKVAP